MRLKRFLMASALALSFTVSAPAVAKADPITAAIVTWAGFTAGTTAFAVATFVVNSALYAAGSWAVTKAAKALGLMKSNVAERQASVTTLSLGETPREAVVGIACVGGSLIDAWNHGGKYGTDYVTRRVALADHVLDGLIGYYVDDTYYPFAANGVQPGFNGALQLTFVNATRDGAAPPGYMLQAGVGLTSEDRCPSVAEIWITYKFDDQVWTRGHPGLKFVVRGLRTYDPRFDPQYGYTGPSPQTWDDVSTHRFSENAAVVRYNIQRGVYAVGRHGELEHLLIGRGLTADEAPAARIIAAANVCDEIVDGLPRYTVGGAISSAQAHIEVEEMFAAATAGQIVQRDGGVEVEPGQAKAAVVTITDADLVAGEAISFDEFTPDTDGGRVNTVIARYVEPSQLYKDHSGAVLRDQADIVEDGGPRELTLPLMLVTNKGQADRCAEITRRGARLERRARIALVPMLLAGRASAELEDGDIIAWQSNRYHEGATVRYRIEAYGVDEGWRNTLQLREMASSVFGQADPVEDRAAPPPAPTPIDALQLAGVQAEAITLPGDSSAVPAIRFRWDAPVDAAVLAIRAEVRRSSQTETAPTRTEQINDGVMVVTNGVGPDQSLQARLVPIGDPSRPVLPSAWITVSTSGLVAGDVSPNAPGLSQIRSDIEAAFGDIFNIDGLLTQARTDIDAQGTEIAAARGGEGNLSARLSQLNQFRIDGDTALGTSITNLTARTANTEADIIDLENAAANDRTATAQSIEQVRAAWRGQAINANPSFAQWPNPNAAPTAWITSGSVTREAGKVSPYCARLTGEATLLYTGADLRAVGGGAFFIEVDVRRTSSTGTFADAAILLQAFDDSGNLLVDGSKGFTVSTAPLDPDLNGGGTAIGAGFQGETYRLRLFCDVRYAATRRYFLSAVSLAPNLAFDVDQLALRPATNAEILAGRNLPGLSASVTEQSLAIIDLENQQALASWSIKAAATGGKPTILQLLSGSFGSSIAMTAEQIYFGDNTVFDDATDTIQTVWGSTRKVMAWGAPFGPDNLVEWTGPSSIALGSMTKANAGFWVDQVGAYGPTPLPSFWAKVTPTQISRSRTGAGSISTALNDVIVTCYTGTSGATCTWSRVSGDTTINYPSTSFTPVFNTTLAAGQTKTALFVGLVAKGGDVDLVYVNVEFSDNV